MDGYKFDFAVSAEIASGTIKEMIKAVVEEQIGRKVKGYLSKLLINHIVIVMNQVHQH